MTASAIIQSKVVKFCLSPSLVRARKRNDGKTLSDAAAIKPVEAKRRAAALLGTQPCANMPDTLTLLS